MLIDAAGTHDYADLEVTSGEKLGAEITELCSYIYAATSQLLSLIREFDEQQYWAELGFLSCAHWLNFACGFGMNSARERLRVAHALAGLPKINEEFSAGKISYSKVRAITRVADENNEDYLLMTAHHGTAHHVERLVAQYRRARKLQDAEFANEQYLKREVTYYYDHDGYLVLKARMPADQGEQIVKALEMAMDAANDVAANQVPSGQTSEVIEAEEKEPIAARRADALAGIAETYMNNNESSGSTADRYQVVIHVAANAAHKNASWHSAHLDNGPHVSAETSRRIGCDCCKTTIIEDENGEPLCIGRRSRTIPPAIRRALWARDGGCRFPGCTHHRFVDGHHIKHWADGGETCLGNLVLLCRYHHHLVHEGGFACQKADDGEIWFENQRSQRLADHAELPGVAIEESLAWMYRKFVNSDINRESCTAKWYAGEEMDWDIAVAAMFAPREPGPQKTLTPRSDQEPNR
ncbi:MAG: DUF222 domain-containing protein [Gammaproteobacteria bacterium]|nr:DUF222 domain-containing protein [Gammaproteobacteria bacterium]